MKVFPAMRSALLTAALSILAVVLVIVLGARLDRAIRDEIVNRFEQRQLLLVEQTAANIQHVLDHAVRDLAYLTAPDGPLRLSDLEKAEQGSEIVAWQATAAQNLLLFLRYHPTCYGQIRYIDADGQEIVGVDRDEQAMRVIPPDELRSQAQRDFFVETMALDEGEVHISRPEVALGHGEVGAGLLTVHMATPVFDSQRQRRGIVVLNLAADAIRGPIADLSIEEGVDTWMLDETGVELVNITHPALEGTNAYERIRRAGDEHLEALTEDMLTGGRGTAIYLWPAGAGSLREQRVMAYAPVYLPGGHFWSVGTSVTYTSIVAAYSQTRRVLLLLGGIIVLVVLIGATLTVRSGHRRVIAEERARRSEELEALLEISRAITAQLELDKLLQNIVEQGCRLLRAELGGLLLLDERSGDLELAAQHGYGGEYVDVRIKPGEGITGRVLQSGEPLAVEDYRRWEGRSRQWFSGVPTASVGVPLKRGEQAIGALIFAETGRARHFDERDIRLASLFAGQASVAIENARLHQELQDYAHRLEQRVQERAAQLQAQYARLEAILRSVSDGIVVTDADGEILEANSPAQTWLTRSLSPEDTAILREAIGSLARKAPERPERVLELTGLDLELRAAPIAEPGVERAAAVVAIHDVSHLKALDRMKSQFVSNVSHELRTPITTIKLYAALMRDAPPEKMREYLEALTREADWQVRLVEDILEISRIEAGRLEMKPRPTLLNELTEMTVVSHEAAARERGLTLEHAPEEPSPTALVDAERIIQVLDNLVMNAIRYTPEEGRVVVSTSKAEAGGRTWATVTVADTGIGIPEEELPHIFERFFRGEQPRAMQIPGTGLGLAIVKEIVELHGGWVTVESRVGAGSTFTVWLPLAE